MSREHSKLINSQTKIEESQKTWIERKGTG